MELGAAWIHGPSQENPVFRLACQYDLLDPESMTEENQAKDTGGQFAGEPSFLHSSGGSVPVEWLLPALELFYTVLEQGRSFGAGEGGQTAPVPSVGEYLKAELPRIAEDIWRKENGPEEGERTLTTAVWSSFMKAECCYHAIHSTDDLSLEMFGRARSLPGLDCTFPRLVNVRTRMHTHTPLRTHIHTHTSQDQLP